MSIEENKDVVRRFAAAFTSQNVAGIRDVLAPDLAKKVIEEWLPSNSASFAGHSAEVAEVMAEGDRVWALLATSGRQIGPWLGLAATGKDWTNRVAMYARVSDGKIIEMRMIPDQNNLARQLGAKLRAVAQ